MSMKKTCGYNFFILCIFIIFAWNSENTKITFKDISVEDSIHCSDGTTVPVRVFDYNLINQKIFGDNTKSIDLDCDSVFKRLEERLNDKDKMQFYYLYDELRRVGIERACINTHHEPIDDNAIISTIKKGFLNSIKSFYSRSGDNKLLQKIDLFTKVIDARANKQLYKTFTIYLSPNHYYEAQFEVTDDEFPRIYGENYERCNNGIVVPLHDDNGERLVFNPSGLIHEIGHVIFQFFIYDIFNLNNIDDNEDLQEYQ